MSWPPCAKVPFPASFQRCSFRYCSTACDLPKITIFAVAYAVTHRPAHVIHYAGGDSFDARIHGCRIQRHTAPAADPKDANAVTVDLFLHAQEINRGAKVFGVDVR